MEFKLWKLVVLSFCGMNNLEQEYKYMWIKLEFQIVTYNGCSYLLKSSPTCDLQMLIKSDIGIQTQDF